MPVGALWLFGKKPVKTQPQAGPAKQVRNDDMKQAAAPKPEAQDRPKENKPAEKQAADYLKDLDNADPKVRETALKALAKLKDESTIPSIARRLTDNKDRRFASEALKGFGAAAESEVAKYLQESDKAVRIETCRILTKVGTKASIPALEQTAKAKEKDVAKEAQIAIKEIEKRG
jgi:HEAT repeat protein